MRERATFVEASDLDFVFAEVEIDFGGLAGFDADHFGAGGDGANGGKDVAGAWSDDEYEIGVDRDELFYGSAVGVVGTEADLSFDFGGWLRDGDFAGDEADGGDDCFGHG